MKRGKTSYNDLDIREVEKNTSPSSLDNALQESPDSTQFKLSYYAIRLIRRLLTLADNDHIAIPSRDRLLLDYVLNGKPINEVALQANYSIASVRLHVRKALDQLYQKIVYWEDLANENRKLNLRQEQLEEDMLSERTDLLAKKQAVEASYEQLLSKHENLLAEKQAVEASYEKLLSEHKKLKNDFKTLSKDLKKAQANQTKKESELNNYKTLKAAIQSNKQKDARQKTRIKDLEKKITQMEFTISTLIAEKKYKK